MIYLSLFDDVRQTTAVIRGERITCIPFLIRRARFGPDEHEGGGGETSEFSQNISELREHWFGDDEIEADVDTRSPDFVCRGGKPCIGHDLAVVA